MFTTENRYGPDQEQPEAPARNAGLFGDLGSADAIVRTVIAVIVVVVALAALSDSPPRHANRPHQIAVPMQRAAGVFVVPAKLNGVLTLDFAIDSGASEVSVPLGAFMALKLAGTISDADMLESQTYGFADGSSSEQVRFVIHRIEVGGVVVNDVPATVAPTQGGTLLGQSFLGAFTAWSLDNARHVLWLQY